MAYQHQQKLLTYSYKNERPLPSLAQSEESPRSLWNCAMAMNTESQHEHKRHGCTLPSLNLKKKRRSVSFQLSSLLFCYGVPEDVTQDWYTGEDEEIFKAEARKEVAVFRQMKGGFTGASGESAGDPQLCIVGLEQQLISLEFSRQRARTKKLVKCAVLLEQSKIGTCYGDSDKAERISAAARQYSERSAAQAKMFGDFQYIQSK